MVYLFSYFIVLFEVSLPLSGGIYGVTLTFMTYLVNLKRERGICPFAIIILIHSFQRKDFIEVSLILIGGYYLIYYLLRYLNYSKSNIIVITLFQIIIYLILSIGDFKREYLIINSSSFLILNYIYMRISKKKDSIKG